MLSTSFAYLDQQCTFKPWGDPLTGMKMVFVPAENLNITYLELYFGPQNLADVGIFATWPTLLPQGPQVEERGSAFEVIVPDRLLRLDSHAFQYYANYIGSSKQGLVKNGTLPKQFQKDKCRSAGWRTFCLVFWLVVPLITLTVSMCLVVVLWGGILLLKRVIQDYFQGRSTLNSELTGELL